MQASSPRERSPTRAEKEAKGLGLGFTFQDRELDSEWAYLVSSEHLEGVFHAKPGKGTGREVSQGLFMISALSSGFTVSKEGMLVTKEGSKGHFELIFKTNHPHRNPKFAHFAYITTMKDGFKVHILFEPGPTFETCFHNVCKAISTDCPFTSGFTLPKGQIFCMNCKGKYGSPNFVCACPDKDPFQLRRPKKMIGSIAVQDDDRFPNVANYNLSEWTRISREEEDLCYLEDLMTNTKKLFNEYLSYEQGGSRAYDLNDEGSDYDSFIVHRQLRLTDPERSFILQQVYTRLVTLKQSAKVLLNTSPQGQLNADQRRNWELISEMGVTMVTARFPVVEVSMKTCPKLQIGVSTENLPQHKEYVTLWRGMSQEWKFVAAYHELRAICFERGVLDSLHGKLNSNFLRHLCAACLYKRSDIKSFTIQDTKYSAAIVEGEGEYRQRILENLNETTVRTLIDMMTGQAASGSCGMKDPDFRKIVEEAQRAQFLVAEKGPMFRSVLRMKGETSRRPSMGQMMTMGPGVGTGRSKVTWETANIQYPVLPPALTASAPPAEVPDLSSLRIDSFTGSNEKTMARATAIRGSKVGPALEPNPEPMAPKEATVIFEGKERTFLVMYISLKTLVFIEKTHSQAVKIVTALQKAGLQNFQLKTEQTNLVASEMWRLLTEGGRNIRQLAHVVCVGEPVPEKLLYLVS